jgi:predicted O-linked N-acetylglucosamine transferase (SPINDLY family)
VIELTINQVLRQAIEAHKGGRVQEADRLYTNILKTQPKHPDANHNMGVLAVGVGKVEQALPFLKTALEANPNIAQFWLSYIDALIKLDKLADAKAVFDQVKSRGAKGDGFDKLKQRLNETDLDPPQVQIQGLIYLYRKEHLQQALKQAKTLLHQFPQSAILLNIQGAVLQGLGKFELSVDAYNKALAIKPDYADAYNNMGNALKDQGKLEDAIEAYNKALATKPDYAEAYSNMGNALQEQGKLEEAIKAYRKSLAIKPDYASVRAQCLYQLAHVCNWSSIEKDRHLLPKLGVQGEAIAPFSLLALEDAPDRHRLRSVKHSRAKYPQKATLLSAKPTEKSKRLRIGYFSADFHNHATMYLMAQVFAAHDKSHFEIFAYSYGPHKQDEMRQKLVSSVDMFHDVRELNDMQIVELARVEHLDIAVDLKGFTKNTRLAPFAYGLAPVQISYLGYPGTLGTDFMDYIVADPVVIPDDKRPYYPEKVIHLPNSYQPTDNTRVISEKIITREDMGLPSKGFVFCCFNKNYKISPREFDIWMRLLGRVEGSFLWLLKSNELAEQNLKREAEARGINADRLVFAQKVPQAEHLARQKLADIFLDTFNVNAHTTTSDALWAGLPVVTKLGAGFAARVAGSLLTAIGLPELITESEEEYEAVALALATDPTQLAHIKAKLDRNRLTQPLFDSEMYTKHLEAGYQMAYDHYFYGRERSDIVVPK